MSAALQFPTLARAAAAQRQLQTSHETAGISCSAAAPIGPQSSVRLGADLEASYPPPPVSTLAFYRKHTEKLLRRYLMASMLVGRSPSILTEPLIRGWASCRPVESFEDCVIFVLDMEKCLDRLTVFDRLLLKRIVLQEYTFAETALLLNRSERLICSNFADAIDRLTELLLETGTLKMPHRRNRALSPDLDD